MKELLPTLDPYELTLLPNRMFWIRPLVNGQSIEAFTGETISIGPGKHGERKPQAPAPPPRVPEPQPFKPEDLGD